MGWLKKTNKVVENMLEGWGYEKCQHSDTYEKEIHRNEEWGRRHENSFATYQLFCSHCGEAIGKSYWRKLNF